MRPFACDMILVENGKVLLIKRGTEPFKGEWAIPGGRIEDNENAEECARREMKEETGLEIEPIRLVGVYSDPQRDPRGIIAAAYLVKRTGGKLNSGTDAAEARWFPLDKLPRLCSDHGKMLEDAVK